MGIGMVLVVRPTFADAMMDYLSKKGETVYKIGRNHRRKAGSGIKIILKK